MILRLAIRNLRRHTSRNILSGIGIAVATAILFDMVLLGDGIILSFRRQLESLGYELRVTPLGTLPFSSNATIRQGSQVRDTILSDPTVDRCSAMLGASVYLRHGFGDSGTVLSAFALGVDRLGTALYSLREGEPTDPEEPLGIVINGSLAEAAGLEIGDTITIGADRDAQTGALVRAETFRVLGTADFFFDAKDQRTLALPLATLQRLEAKQTRDEISLLMVALNPDAEARSVVEQLRSRVPSVSVLSVEEMVDSIRSRLSYFQQFSRILGMISLVVNFMLIATIVTISVNERFGELAVLRALGFQRFRVTQLILAEAMLLALVAGVAGILLGWVLSGPLDAILRDSPGLPAEVSFFVLTPGAFLQTALFVFLVGSLAGSFSAFVAARLSIASTLRKEAL